MLLQHRDTVAAAGYHASPRLHPPLVSFIALFDAVEPSRKPPRSMR